MTGFIPKIVRIPQSRSNSNNRGSTLPTSQYLDVAIKGPNTVSGRAKMAMLMRSTTNKVLFSAIINYAHKQIIFPFSFNV